MTHENIKAVGTSWRGNIERMSAADDTPLNHQLRQQMTDLADRFDAICQFAQSGAPADEVNERLRSASEQAQLVAELSRQLPP